MLRLPTRKIISVPHSLAIVSAIVLIWSVQAGNTAIDVSRLSEPQQLVMTENCEPDNQVTVVATVESVPTNPWAVLHLF